MGRIEAPEIDAGAVAGEHASLLGFAALLARTQPYAAEAIRQRIEARLTETIEGREVSRIVQPVTPKHRLHIPLSLSRPRRGWAVALVLVLSIALSTTVGGIVLAQRSPRIAPREVTASPDLSRATLEPPSRGRRWMELDELRSRLGGPLLLPSTLPPGCVELERFFHETPRVANVRYSCVLISLRVGGIAMPQVASGSVQDVTVNGVPAIYIDGGWMQNAAPQAAPVWASGPQMLIFERDGLLIQISTTSGDPLIAGSDGTRTRIPNVWQLGRDDLIRIAETLMPAR